MESEKEKRIADKNGDRKVASHFTAPAAEAEGKVAPSQGGGDSRRWEGVKKEDPALAGGVVKDTQPLGEGDLIKAVKILRELIDRMNMEVVITTSGGKESTIFISGPDAGLLVGKKGQTLDALHFLFNRIVHKQLGLRGFVNLDVDGYRSRREEAIRNLALALAEKAVKEGKIVPIRPMSPRERRIVHMALSNNSRVKTQSEGEGDNRHVRIIPIGIKHKS